MNKLKSSDNHITYSNLNSANNKIDFLNNVENKDNYNKKKKSITNKNIFLFLISEFGFSIFLFSAIKLCKYIPKYHPPKIFTSKNNKIFNSTSEPLIFLHLTDIHLSKSRPAKTDGALTFLTSNYFKI